MCKEPNVNYTSDVFQIGAENQNEFSPLKLLLPDVGACPPLTKTDGVCYIKQEIIYRGTNNETKVSFFLKSNFQGSGSP